MKSGDYFIGNGLRQTMENANGKYSTQFMNGDKKKEYPSNKDALNEGIKMGGYNVNISNRATQRADMNQQISGRSDFWLS